MKGNMEFKMHTYDIQKIMMCIMFAEKESVMSKEDKDRYLDNLTILNNKCKPENDYTLNVTVED